MAKIIKKHSKKAFILVMAILFVVGYFSISLGRAATITTREVRISNSTPSASAIYDFLGTTTIAANNTLCIKVRFCNSADTSLACTTATGINVDSGAIYDTTPYTWFVFTSSLWTYAAIAGGDTNDFKLTYITGQSGGVSSSWVVSGITNPTNASGETNYAWINTYGNIDCATTPVDNGVVAFATVPAITASATVLETLTFTVGDMGATCLADHGGSGTDRDATPTTIPFGTVTAEAFYNGCQTLTVSTNATNGYDVTIGESDQLTYGSEQIADGTCDGVCSETTVAPWDTATNNGFGYCMKDSTGDGAATADTEWATEGCGDASEGFKIIPDTGQPETRNSIMSSIAEVADVAEIDYSLSVDATQPAGTYNTTITYIVTPTY